jgi:hypothetical protein
MLAQGESGSMDNPYNPLFAGLMAVWGIMFCGGYKRLQLVYQHEWDTVHLEPANPDRRDFVQVPLQLSCLSLLTSCCYAPSARALPTATRCANAHTVGAGPARWGHSSKRGGWG